MGWDGKTGDGGSRRRGELIGSFSVFGEEINRWGDGDGGSK